MYTDVDYPTKTDLCRAIRNGRAVTVWCPSGKAVPTDGRVYLEGPHYPQAHTWYAQATLKAGRIVAVK